ncbi:MAG: methylthioribose kinase [Bacillales bacterium]|nr:methylthioribose kinase [Bacillales bacterium]
MIQRFIELGEGYSDLYELIEIAKSNQHRLAHLMAFHTAIGEQPATSLVAVLNPTERGEFQPLYICREGIPHPNYKSSQRWNDFKSAASSLGKEIIELDVKPSTFFAEKELFYQYLIGILRMNRYIPPLQ